MEKRKYTHVQMELPEIEAMLAGGKTQREVAEYFGFKDKYGLLSEIRRQRKWRQLGQQLHKYENLLNRDFHADRPNCKWVMDISYIHIKQGVLYLSMVRDLYDKSIVAYKTATQRTMNARKTELLSAL